MAHQWWRAALPGLRKNDCFESGFSPGSMPEHVHLLIGEPRVRKLSLAMQVLKQRVSLRCRGRKRNKANQMRLRDDAAAPPAFCQPRYYDFKVFTQRKYVEKLRYIHSNPVKRGLVESPELWRWSSYRDYWLARRER